MNAEVKISGVMDAGNFIWAPLMIDGKCTMAVSHKFTGKKWYREFAEAEWPQVREELLAQIEADLTSTRKAAPAP